MIERLSRHALPMRGPMRIVRQICQRPRGGCGSERMSQIEEINVRGNRPQQVRQFVRQIIERPLLHFPGQWFEVWQSLVYPIADWRKGHHEMDSLLPAQLMRLR